MELFFSWLNYGIWDQIIGPHDKGIAAAIQTNLEPVAWDTSLLEGSSLYHDRTSEMTDEYFGLLTTLSRTKWDLYVHAITNSLKVD